MTSEPRELRIVRGEKKRNLHPHGDRPGVNTLWARKKPLLRTTDAYGKKKQTAPLKGFGGGHRLHGERVGLDK